jgi:Phosphate transporter family
MFQGQPELPGRDGARMDNPPAPGFRAKAGGVATLFIASTHTITGAIVGMGAARKAAAARWNNVVVAWVLTMPAAASIAVFYKLGELLRRAAARHELCLPQIMI